MKMFFNIVLFLSPRCEVIFPKMPMDLLGAACRGLIHLIISLAPRGVE